MPPWTSWHSAQSRRNVTPEAGSPWPLIPMCVCALFSVWFTDGSFRWHASQRPYLFPSFSPYWFAGSPTVPKPRPHFQLLSNPAPATAGSV